MEYRRYTEEGTGRRCQNKEIEGSDELMFDVHHHLLYGLDDGPGTIEDSIVQAEAAVANGITHIVCTPHASHRYPYVPELVAERIARLRAALIERGVSLTLGQGCDFHLNYDNVEDAKKYPLRYSINGHRYLLIELQSSFYKAQSLTRRRS